jgi:hypothetical protein
MARLRRAHAYRLAAAALALAAIVAACGRGAATDAAAAGDIPDNQVYVAYSPPAGGFSVQVPEGWARTEAGGVVTFTDKFNRVRVETGTAPNAPTAQSAERDEVPAIRASSTNFSAAKVSTVARSGGPAVLITYQADAAPDPVTGKAARLDVERYEFWKDGRTVVLALSGAVGSDNVDPWRTVSDSFRWA